jgi:hypothetical protein
MDKQIDGEKEREKKSVRERVDKTRDKGLV